MIAFNNLCEFVCLPVRDDNVVGFFLIKIMRSFSMTVGSHICLLDLG